MLEYISLNFSDTGFVTAQREERAYLKLEKIEKNYSSPHVCFNCFESFMTRAVFPEHPILCDMVTLDTLLKGSCSRKLFEYI